LFSFEEVDASSAQVTKVKMMSSNFADETQGFQDSEEGSQNRHKGAKENKSCPSTDDATQGSC
jgi:hypothetical protein